MISLVGIIRMTLRLFNYYYFLLKITDSKVFGWYSVL